MSQNLAWRWLCESKNLAKRSGCTYQGQAVPAGSDIYGPGGENNPTECCFLGQKGLFPVTCRNVTSFPSREDGWLLPAFDTAWPVWQ